MVESTAGTGTSKRTRTRARPPKRTPFGELYFGMSDSRNEANQDEDHFIKSYVDIGHTVHHVLDGSKFLVLGHKGTGKSALAWYLKSTEGHSYLTVVQDASQLPLSEIPRVLTGQDEGPGRTVVAWKFILLCSYLQLLLRDQSVTISPAREVRRVAKLLRDFGFTDEASGSALLSATKTTTGITVPKLGAIYQREKTTTLNIFNLIPYLEAWSSTAKSTFKHLLILDGLDSILLNDRRYDESLSSLVQAAYALNQRFRSENATGRIVLLLRNDVFSRISWSLPDSQKMRDDFSIDLDWRVLSGEAGANAPLIQLVNKKASKAASADVDVLSYFPQGISVGAKGRKREIPTLQYLLNMTRHTPRDLLRLFEEIKKIEGSEIFPSSPSGPISQAVIREGVLQYSTKYFVDAIRNEFAGFEAGPDRAEQAMSALRSMGRQIFDRSDFKGHLPSDPPLSDSDIDRLLRLLFFSGAIGNYVYRPKRDSYMQFYHRRNDAEIYLHGNFILHEALIHAWAVPR